ncbi:SnoaL-like domain-containing protein [Nannocystis exedens]|uniref:SnoaL-like domain-containing protein n=1 Tax=Nannocystis exedens TaxID=54 RepID=A0A1I2EFX9_9BACT|nr:nuclear transport factor 2 family protein [Nannocystis exedens]PCC74726.1 SnoaL-like domain protein [Nannocystis exedens]SFE91954.1 SnoaL-like domain-containing protein [Nannocystis exedens]
MDRRQALTTLLMPLAASACGGPAGQVRPDATGVRLLSEFWARVYNPPPDLDTIDRLCTEDFILTTAGTDVVGRAAFKEWVRSFSAKIRELRLTSHDMFGSADGTRVVSRWVVTGFNQGILNTPADDRPIEFTGISVWEVRDGKLAHNWVERSAYELAQRLAQPSPPDTGPR